MAEIKLYETRDSMIVGDEIYMDVLAGRDVVGDPLALAWAFEEAARDLGEQWMHLAGQMHEAVRGYGDSVVGDKVLEARQEVARITEIAYSLLAVLSEHTMSIIAAEEGFDRSPSGDDHNEAEVT